MSSGRLYATVGEVAKAARKYARVHPDTEVKCELDGDHYIVWVPKGGIQERVCVDAFTGGIANDRRY